MKKRTTLLVLILWRLISVFIVQTAHVPDEYWQSLEVAHNLAFGYGYLTWEWRLGIRSYIYPFCISILYRILDIFHLDYVEVLLIMPKIFQAFLSGYADYRFYLWTNKSKLALYCLIFNWYWYYCATRTLINTVETAVTMIALSMFPWKNYNSLDIWRYDHSTDFLWLVGFLSFIRPTAVIIWLPLLLYYLWTRKKEFLTSSIFICCLIGGVILFVSIIIDIILYQRFIITPWEFLKANIILKISEIYGVESFYWYFYAGLPVVLGLKCILLPIVSYQICRRPSYYIKQFVLLVSIIWTLFVYSFLSHKEFRFILPLLPMLIYVTTTVHTLGVLRKIRKIMAVLFFLSNIVPGIYFSLLHQRGSLDVMKYLHRQLQIEDSNVDLLFLTPCHATPLYSHLHQNVSVRFLTCEPNVNKVEDYIEEADYFFKEPVLWLNSTYKDNSALPSHLIVFDNVIDKISPFLEKYDILTSIFYAHFTEGNYGRNIVVYKRKMNLDEKLDNLVLLNLELMEEKVVATVDMEKSLRNAQIELAKARMIRGKEAIGTTQIPIHTYNIKSLFELESVISDENGTSVPQFDISLKQNECIQNPLKWFGILVPQSLKSAQRHFQESIYKSVKVANIQAKLIGVLNEIELIKEMKNQNSNQV